MKLRKDNWNVKLVELAYPEFDLPNSLCVFFWKWLFALILIPISWPVLLYNFIQFKNNRFLCLNHYISLLFFAVSFCIFMGVLPDSVKDFPSSKLYQLVISFGFFSLVLINLFGIIIVTVGTSLIIGFIYMIIWLNDEIRSLFKSIFLGNSNQVLSYSAKGKSSEPGILTSWIRAVKQKVCPRIEYISEETKTEKDV